MKTNQKTNFLKAHVIAFCMDLFALGSYFGFQALSDFNSQILAGAAEIVINEGYFYTFMLLIVLFFHILIALFMHVPILNKGFREKVFTAGVMAAFGLTFFSGYFVSTYVENKLKNANYHLCENLSYEKPYRSTHYVWRAEEITCQ